MMCSKAVIEETKLFAPDENTPSTSPKNDKKREQSICNKFSTAS
jgi:hypothetical protein